MIPPPGESSRPGRTPPRPGWLRPARLASDPGVPGLPGFAPAAKFWGEVPPTIPASHGKSPRNAPLMKISLRAIVIAVAAALVTVAVPACGKTLTVHGPSASGPAPAAGSIRALTASPLPQRVLTALRERPIRMSVTLITAPSAIQAALPNAVASRQSADRTALATLVRPRSKIIGTSLAVVTRGLPAARKSARTLVWLVAVDPYGGRPATSLRACTSGPAYRYDIVDVIGATSGRWITAISGGHLPPFRHLGPTPPRHPLGSPSARRSCRKHR